MAVVKILRREGELFQVANRPLFCVVGGRRGGRLIRVLRERGRGERRSGENRGAEENGREDGEEIASHWKPFLDEVNGKNVERSTRINNIDVKASHNNKKNAASPIYPLL